MWGIGDHRFDARYMDPDDGPPEPNYRCDRCGAFLKREPKMRTHYAENIIGTKWVEVEVQEYFNGKHTGSHTEEHEVPVFGEPEVVDTVPYWPCAKCGHENDPWE